MKKLTLSILSLIFVLCATVGLTACGKEKHTHSFTAQKAEQQYLASAATCAEAAKYYYSCSCGEKGTQTFTSGNALGHKFTNYVSDSNATCTTDGTKTATCDHKGCNETDTITDEGSKLGHKFTNYVSDNNATCTQDGTKTATCDHDGCHETDTITDEGSKLPHTYDKQVASEKYLASAATCTEAAKYYYSCACGEKGTQTFTSGNPNGHTYSEEWSQSTTEHWHAATCGHNVESGRAKHNFDENKKCTVCDYVTTQPLGLELQSTSFEVNLSKKTAYLKVTNAVTDYDFSDKFTVADGARFDVCTDKQCNNKIASKKSDIVAGDNVFYILVTNGNDVASYTITLRRRPIYTVTFDTNGGSEVESQQVEEDSFATEPTTTKKGYNFVKWNYDFSTPILQNQTITASWNIITYNITYELNGGENAENNPTTYTVEDEIALSLPTKTGYTGTWSSGGKIEKGSIGDITFTASYTINQHKVTVTPSISGICTINNAGTYDYNTAVTLSLSDLYLGYEITGWYNGETLLSTDNAYSFNVPANDITITAKLSVKEEMQNYKFTSTTATCNITGVKDKTITSAIIPDYITSIGNSAFDSCSGLTSIIWNAENCTSAGLSNYPIFNNCNNLTQITIGENVKTIPFYAFYGCSGLTSVTIPDSVTSIGDYAFYACNGLKSVIIGNGVTSIGDYAFYACSGLKSIIIGNSVTSIGSSAFSGCSGLTSVTIPDSVTSIGNSAFYNCSGLTNITIPDSVASIDDYAFYNCSGLTSITIPDSVTSIGYSAFSYCHKLVEVINKSKLNIKKGSKDNGCVAECALNVKKDGESDIVNKDGYLFYTANDKNYLLGDAGTETALTLPANYNGESYEIYDYVFYKRNDITSVTIPDSVTSIGDYAFYACSGLKSIIIGNSVTSIGNSAFSGCSGLTSVTIPDSVTSIGNSAFSGCSGLTSVTIPDSVTSIGYSAFYNCSELTNITIPDSVASIDDYAFYNCSGLTSITIPDSVTSIGSSAFYNCSGLTSIIWNAENCTSAGSYNFSIFNNCYKLTQVTIGENVKTIPSYAFSGCSGLKSVTIGNSVTSIGNGAFYDCNGLKSVTIDNSVTSIGNSAFSGCSGLTSVTIPDSVTSIGSSAFSGCSGLTSITIPDSVTSIGGFAFLNCSGLTNIYITDISAWCNISGLYNLMKYGVFKKLYLNNELITDLVIPDSVTSIGDYAFYACSGLTSITIPNGVTSIGDYAFYACSGLTSITIPNGVTSIGSSAFYGCDKLVEVINNSSLNTTKGSSDNGYVAYYALNVKDGGNSDIVNQNDYLFYTYGGINYLVGYVGVDTDLVLPNNYNGSNYEIYKYAFYNCSGLTSVTIPDSVTTIAQNAFYFCSELSSISYEGTEEQWSNITKEQHWYSNCSGNLKLHFPNGKSYRLK